jgi:hypothetical protein
VDLKSEQTEIVPKEEKSINNSQMEQIKENLPEFFSNNDEQTTTLKNSVDD